MPSSFQPHFRFPQHTRLWVELEPPAGCDDHSSRCSASRPVWPRTDCRRGCGRRRACGELCRFVQRPRPAGHAHLGEALGDARDELCHGAARGELAPHRAGPCAPPSNASPWQTAQFSAYRAVKGSVRMASPQVQQRPHRCNDHHHQHDAGDSERSLQPHVEVPGRMGKLLAAGSSKHQPRALAACRRRRPHLRRVW